MSMEIFNIFTSIWMLVFSILGIISTSILILIVLLHRQCRTKANLLVVNSASAGFLINVTCACQSIYQLVNSGNDLLCAFRGFLIHSFTGLLYHTLLVQALHRLFVNVFANRPICQSNRFMIGIVVVQWFISISFAIPMLLLGRFRYQSTSQMCLASLNDLYGYLYLATWIYFVPISCIIAVYVSIVQHVKTGVTFTANHSAIFERRRQQREIRLFRRLLALLSVLCVMGIPYTIFFILALINGSSPAFAERISFLFISFGYGSSMLINSMNNDEIRNIFFNLLRLRHRTHPIQCITTIHRRT